MFVRTRDSHPCLGSFGMLLRYSFGDSHETRMSTPIFSGQDNTSDSSPVTVSSIVTAIILDALKEVMFGTKTGHSSEN
jgi:hypothetical protein